MCVRMGNILQAPPFSLTVLQISSIDSLTEEQKMELYARCRHDTVGKCETTQTTKTTSPLSSPTHFPFPHPQKDLPTFVQCTNELVNDINYFREANSQ